MRARTKVGGFSAVVAVVAACSGDGAAPGGGPHEARVTVGARDARLLAVDQQARGGYVRRGSQIASSRAHWVDSRLPEVATGPRTLRVAGGTMTLVEPGVAAATAEVNDGVAIYRDAYPDTDSVWMATPTLVEELWVLESARAPRRFHWQVSLDGLGGPERAPDGSFVFTDGAGRAALRMPAPYALDARGRRLAVDAHFDARTRTFRFDLPAGELAYPVTVDPSLVIVPQWKQLSSTKSPSARSGAAMTYVPKTQSMLLFGGVECATLPGCLKNDLWELKNGQWQEVTASGTLPAARMNATLTYDPTLDMARLYGGFDGSLAMLSEVWYSGGAWQASLATPPNAREGHSATYVSSSTKVMIIFGQGQGNLMVTPYLGGLSWAGVTGTGPSPRRDSTLAHDSAQSRTLAFGGRPCMRGGTCSPLGDLWARASGVWSQPTTTGTPPPPRWGHAMVYDDKRLVSVVFGGRTQLGLSAETYELENTAWWTNDKTAKPPARAHAAMAFDSTRGVTVLFGGNSSSVEPEQAAVHLGDTWEYAPTPIACNTGSECATGFCVDGVCCESAACGTCQTCASAAQPGTCTTVDGSDADTCAGGSCAAGVCTKPAGAACTGQSECGANLCTGGVCCPTACTEPCASCASGVCQPAAAGTAVGACGAYACDGVSSSCPTSCSATTGCSAGLDCHLATGTCRAKTGSACSSADECASGFCTDDVCCESACSGACEVCSAAAGASKNGVCEPAPKGSEKGPECAQGCDGKTRACTAPTACAKSGDCPSGICVGGRCCASLYDCGTECSSDGTKEIERATKQETPCEHGCFFGRCAATPLDCRSGKPCAAGERCTAQGTCVAGSAAGESFEPGTPLGCLCRATGARTSGDSLGWLVTALGGALARRRGRGRRA
ncbi:MAG: hypothetical protein HYZ29_19205 [Myxococcales bacterium]|nr:hypothetical protein [Myxococcales bacterium]